MFHPLAYDERSRTYLARFSGALTEQDQVDFATAARECLLLHGPTAGLQDYREVTSCAITANQTVSRGRSRPIMTGQKRVVVADGLVFGMMRMFGVYQSEQGQALAIVRTLTEAYDELGLKADEFRPIALAQDRR